MKKILFSIIALSFLAAGIGTLAQDDNLPSPGITPDSPFYFLKTWKESIQTFFAFGEEDKAKQFLHLAEVRLAEYQKMTEKGKTEIAGKTLEKYEKRLNQALEKTGEAEKKGKDVKKLKETISEKIIRHQEALVEALEKAPEEAKEGIENAIEMSQKGFENSIRAISGEKKEELERKAEDIKSRLEKKEETEPDMTTPPETDKSGSTEPAACIQVITPAIGPGNTCKEFPTPCDVPKDWRKVDKCPQSAAVPPHPEEPPAEQTPTEVRYYTCPDGSKVISGKCYGKGTTLSCNILSSPELQCPAPTPPVTKGGECQTAGETKYYQCPSSSPISQTPWCVCGPESGAVGAKNAWRCQNLPELYCPKPTPIASSDYISCQKGGTQDHKCIDGTSVRWQCECLNIVPQATAYWDWNCVLEPVKFCSAPNTSGKPAISEIEVRNYDGSIRIFAYTTTPTVSYVEYGPTTSYGAKVASGNFLSASQPDTVYHFRIIAEDTNGNKVTSDDYTFTTNK